MSNSNEYFINSDGQKLYRQVWYPELNENQRPKAVVFIIHGLSEHSSFYYKECIVDPLLKLKCLVIAHDHLGHGLSEGDRIVLAPIDKLVRDVVHHVDHTMMKLCGDNNEDENSDNYPVFLYGHSLGGLIACLVATQRPGLLDKGGLLLESPALSFSRSTTNTVALAACRFLSAVRPQMILRRPNFLNLSRDQTVVENARMDPLRNRQGISIGTASAISTAIHKVSQLLPSLVTPFFAAHGKLDPIVPYAATELLQKLAATPKDNQEVHIYSDGLHVLRSSDDEIGQQFTAQLVAWVQKRIYQY